MSLTFDVQPTTPAAPSPQWEVHEGDALSVLTTLPASSVDAVITDPPYNSGGTTATARKGSAKSKYVGSNSQARHTLADFGGDSRDQRSYTLWLTLLLTEARRVTTEGGNLLVFTDWRQLPATSDAVQAAGWTWRGLVVWHKPNARPRRNGFRQNTEYVLWATNGPVAKRAQDVYLPGLLTGSQPSGKARRHITQKPVEVMAELVRIVPPGGRVLDPFTGSGTTGVAALQAGLHFVGVEESAHYAALARERLADTA